MQAHRTTDICRSKQKTEITNRKVLWHLIAQPSQQSNMAWDSRFTQCSKCLLGKPSMHVRWTAPRLLAKLPCCQHCTASVALIPASCSLTCHSSCHVSTACLAQQRPFATASNCMSPVMTWTSHCHNRSAATTDPDYHRSNQINQSIYFFCL